MNFYKKPNIIGCRLVNRPKTILENMIVLGDGKTVSWTPPKFVGESKPNKDFEAIEIPRKVSFASDVEYTVQLRNLYTDKLLELLSGENAFSFSEIIRHIFENKLTTEFDEKVIKKMLMEIKPQTIDDEWGNKFYYKLLRKA